MSSTASHWFVVPRLDGPITGGTRYNRALIAALRMRRLRAEPLRLDEARRALAAGRPGIFWVDSLYLDDLPRLAAEARETQIVGAIVHYLPSLVDRAAVPTRRELMPAERAALDGARALIAPSPFMRAVLERLVEPKPILIVEPGYGWAASSEPRARRVARPSAVHAVMIANLVAAKGIAPFLIALGRALAESDPLRLVIAGGAAAEPRYAATCEAIVQGHPLLATRVRFTGMISPSAVHRLLANSNLFVSASRMESFGMALAEARVLGLPIVARPGGNIEAHIGEAAGGELLADDDALAGAVVRLARHPEEHAARLRRARAAAYAPRPWSLVAAEFVSQAERLESSARDSPAYDQ